MESLISACAQVVQQALIPLTYTHVIIFSSSLAFAYLLYANTKKSELVSIFWYICLTISLWLVLNFATWIFFYNPLIVRAAWAPIELTATLAFFFTYYFVYYFINRKSLPKYMKVLFGVLLGIIFVASPTKFNLDHYSYVDCEVVEGHLFITFVFLFKMLCTVLSVYQLAVAYRLKNISRKQITILLVAVSSFLAAFQLSSYISSLTGNYMFDIYGLFGVIVFYACLAYLTVNENIFESKVFAAQMLIAAIFIINLPGIFFAHEPLDIILWSLESIVIIAIGYFLVKSVRKEIEQNVVLQQKNEELIELNKAKTEFLSFASHQLKTPLTAMKWGLGELKCEGATPEQKSIVEQLTLTSGQMLRTVTDFLNSAKLESNELKLEKKVFALDELVRGVERELQSAARQKGIELRVDLGEPILVSADQTKVEQVLMILVDNAIKYTAHGSVTIRMARTGGMVSVMVVDTGPGMQPGETGTLFQKYQRGSAAATNSKGSGIGLYLARKIIEMHNGHVLASSPGPGQGSTFTMELPLEG